MQSHMLPLHHAWKALPGGAVTFNTIVTVNVLTSPVRFNLTLFLNTNIRFVFQHLPEANGACLVGVYAVTLDPYFPYMEQFM